MEDEQLDVAVKFGQLQIGAETCRLAIAVDKESLKTETVERFFCGSDLEVKLKSGADAAASADGQSEIEGTSDEPVIDTVSQAKTCGIKKTQYTSGLTFNLNAVDVSVLAKFACKPGRLVAKRLGDKSE